MTYDAASEARETRSVGCPACLEPNRWKRHRARLGCSVIEARRDQAAELYRMGLSEREVAAHLGVSVTTIHFDLEARGVARRPQTAGLKRYKPTPELRQAALAGRRAKARRARRRGLIGRREVLKRTYLAGVPRSLPGITADVEKGLLKREPGFHKRWLFSEASVDEYIGRLLADRTKRLQRTTQTSSRLKLIEDLHGEQARIKAHRRLAPKIAAERGVVVGRPRGSRILTTERKQAIVAGRAEGRSNREIARELHVDEATVRRFKPPAD